MLHNIHLPSPADWAHCPSLYILYASSAPFYSAAASQYQVLLCHYHRAGIVCGLCLDAKAVAPAFRAAGRLDHVINLRSPGADERTAVLQSALEAKGNVAVECDLQVGCSLLQRMLADMPAAFKHAGSSFSCMASSLQHTLVAASA